MPRPNRSIAVIAGHNIKAQPRAHCSSIMAAWLAGSMAGATLVAGYLLAMGVLMHEAEMGALMAGLGLQITFWLWGAGLLVLGLPTGAVLHACGLRSAWVGAVAGAALTSGLTLDLWILPTSNGGTSAVIAAVLGSSLSGAIVGGLVTRIAYWEGHRR